MKQSVLLLLFFLIIFAMRKTAAQGTWVLQSSGTTQNLFDIYFPDTNIGWIVGSNSTVRKSTNGGINWSAQSPPSAWYYNSTFLSETYGFISGTGGVVAKTTNGGSTWSVLNTGTSSDIYGLKLLNANDAWINGNGFVRKTSDGGSTWTVVTPSGLGGSTFHFGIEFVNNNIGWTVGSSGRIFKTTNGGSSWTQQTSPISNWFRDVKFFTPLFGIIAGDGGAILKTTNGGTNWAQKTSNTTEPLYDVFIMDANTVWVVGGNGTILYSSDAGETWTAQTSPTTETLQGIHFADANNGWIGGYGGTVLKYVPPPSTPACTNLTNPLNGATNVYVSTALSWAASSNATGYKLNVGTSPGGTDILNNFDVGNVTTYDPPGEFPVNTTIYVKITPYNAGGDATGCTEESFTTTPTCVQFIAAPANGAVLDNGCTPPYQNSNLSEWSFDWSDCAGATFYHLWVKHPSAQNPYIDNDTLTLSELLYSQYGYTSSITGWEVKVRAFINGAWSVWSPIVAFNVEPPGTDCPPVCNSSLTNPANGAANVPVTTTFTWNASGATTGYLLVAGTTSGGSDILDSVDVGNVTTYDPPGNLPYDTTIYVSVIPYNANGNAVGCVEKSFTTEILPPPPACTALTNPLNGAINVPVTTSLAWVAASGATGYRLTVGTTSGGTDILDNLDVGNVVTYNPVGNFPANTNIYVTLVPYNAGGDATGCMEESFMTGDNTCLSGGITFSTQAQIDAFPSNYPGCTEVLGHVTIQGNNIGNLNGLSQIALIDGNLLIQQNPNLNNLNGLQNLTSINEFMGIYQNNILNDITALSGITTLPLGLGVSGNPQLASLDGLDNLTSMGSAVLISGNAVLNDITALSSVTNINGYLRIISNGSLQNLDGLQGLTTVTSQMEILGNGQLQTVVGLENLASIGRWLRIEDNAVLNSLAALSNLNTINANNTATAGYLYVINNDSLHSLGGLDNLDETKITNLKIESSANLSTCDVASICNYLADPSNPATIAGNATGCANRTEVWEECGFPPLCTTLTSPLDGETNVPVTSALTWDAAFAATGYKLTVGTTPGGMDILNNFDVGNVVTHDPAGDFPNGAIIYVTITPYNANGDSVGCMEESFSTVASTPFCESITNDTLTLYSCNGTMINTNIMKSLQYESGPLFEDFIYSGTPLHVIAIEYERGGMTYTKKNNVSTNTYEISNVSLAKTAPNVLVWVGEIEPGFLLTRTYTVSLTSNELEISNELCNNSTYVYSNIYLLDKVDFDNIDGCGTYSFYMDVVPGAKISLISICDPHYNIVFQSGNPANSIAATMGFGQTSPSFVYNNPEDTNGALADLSADLVHNIGVLGIGQCQTVSTTSVLDPEILFCTNLTAPLEGATGVVVTSSLTWAAATGATGYKLTVGTTPGGTDILNNFDVGNVTTYNPAGDFPSNTTIYVKIVPYNATGNAAGCLEESFTTETVVVGCLPGGIVFSTQTQIDAFPANYPGCTTILGNVTIEECCAGAIMNLNGLSQITSIDGGLFIYNTPQLTNLNGLLNLTSINGPLEILNNQILVSLNGIQNINAAGITHLSIVNNQSLDECDVQSVCNYLNLPMNVSTVSNNSGNCESIPIILVNCPGTIPVCVTLTNPLNGAANVPVTSSLSWVAAPNATGYRLTVGTTPGGTDILNNFDLGNVTTYDPAGNFPYSSTIYVKITPYNANGDAVGCAEESFMTDANPVPANDECANATVLIMGADACTPTAYSNLGATVSSNTAYCSGGSFPDIWFTTIVNSSNEFNVSIGNLPAGGNGFIMEVYDNDNCATGINHSIYCGVIVADSTYNIPAGPGAYTIRIESFGVGDIELCVWEPVTSPYDDCPGAPITVGNTCNYTSIDNTNWVESFEPSQCGALEFFQDGFIQVSVNGDFTIEFSNIPWGSAMMEIYEGTSCLPFGNSVYCAEISPLNLSHNIIGVTAGNYLIRIGSDPAETDGDFGICIWESPLPPCTNLTSPLNAATNVPITTALTWAASANATGYKLTVGTTSGGTDILNNVDVGNVTTYDPPGNLPSGTLIFVKITPYNGAGDALGCAEENFTTASECPTGDLVFTTQAEIDSFPILYPNCTVLTGNVCIGDCSYPHENTDISNLNGLSQLTGISGNLAIFSNPNLANLTGLGNLATIGGSFSVTGNAGLSSYAGLGNLNSVGADMYAVENPALTNLNGLGGLASIGGGLYIVGNGSLVDLTALVNLMSINGYLSIGSNDALASLSGLENIDPMSIDNLLIQNSSVLSFCEVQSICDYLAVPSNPATITGNAIGCADRPAVEAACTAVPLCSNLTNPANGATNVPITTSLNWASSPTATGYRLSIGTSPGGTDILNNSDLGNVTTYDPAGDFPYGTVIYVKITPYNASGDANACIEESFTTSSCIPNLLVVSIPVPAGNYHSLGDLVSHSSTVEAGTLVLFTSDTGVLLGYNFTVETGAVFEITTQGCP